MSDVVARQLTGALANENRLKLGTFSTNCEGRRDYHATSPADGPDSTSP
jgi:hypothetical protein